MPASLKEMEVPLGPGEDLFVRLGDDPWGKPYHLCTNPPCVVSNGPDGEPDTDDDVRYPVD